MELVECQVRCWRCHKVLTEAESDSHSTECRNAWWEREEQLSRFQRPSKERISCWHCRRAFDVSPERHQKRAFCPYCRRSNALPDRAPHHLDWHPLPKTDYDWCRFCCYFLPLHSLNRHIHRVHLGNDVHWVRDFVRSNGSLVEGHYRWSS